jgi:hypothetical protein
MVSFTIDGEAVKGTTERTRRAKKFAFSLPILY